MTLTVIATFDEGPMPAVTLAVTPTVIATLDEGQVITRSEESRVW